VKLNQVSNYSFGEAEALTDEIEEEGLMMDEVLRIKEVLKNFENETDSVVFESLRRLQFMQLTVDILKATEIGKTVNGIRKHAAKHIRHLARELISEWKAIVDEWVQTTQETKGPALDSEEGTPDSVHPSIDYEDGLPSPPMDDCAFFTTQNIDFSQFFDGMDDDGNPRNSGEFNKNQERGRRPAVIKRDAPKQKDQSIEEAIMCKEQKVQQVKQEPPSKPISRSLNTASGPRRNVKPNTEQRMNPVHKLQQRSDKPNIPRRPILQPENIRRSNEDPVQVKLEATKRKLQERYLEAEKAKKQRTIQVMELHDLPKHSLAQRNFNKFGNNRNWANARR